MLDRVEDVWDLPAAATASESDRGELSAAEPGANVHPLWPWVFDGRPRPVFAYPIAASEYLEFDDQSPIKHEFVRGFVYAMAGASAAHVTIVGNLVVAIRPRLRGSGCRDLFNDMRVAIPDVAEAKGEKGGGYYYPDFLMTCSKAEQGPSIKLVEQPCLVVEVSSPSTATADRTEKLDNYRLIPTLEQYWIVEQDRRRIIVYARDGGDWRVVEHTSAESVLHLPVGELAIRLEDVYLGVFEAT